MSESPPTKKQKTSDRKDVGLKVEKSRVERLIKDFELTEILNNNAHEKTICLRGHYSDRAGESILVLEKTPFDSDAVKKFCCEETQTEVILENERNTSFTVFPPASCSAVKTTVVYPATSGQLKGYKTHQKIMLVESPEDYKRLTLPYIELYRRNLQFMYGVLDKKIEKDRIFFEDPDPAVGFVMLPDIKWDGIQIANLHVLAIVQDRSLHSIRDLTEKNLGLLQNLRDTGTAAIVQKYGLAKDRILAYFHYQPSFYHLHLHFVNLNCNDSGRDAGKAHLLNDVIDCIHLDGAAYQKKTLTFFVREGHALHKKFSARISEKQ